MNEPIYLLKELFQGKLLHSDLTYREVLAFTAYIKVKNLFYQSHEVFEYPILTPSRTKVLLPSKLISDKDVMELSISIPSLDLAVAPFPVPFPIEGRAMMELDLGMADHVVLTINSKGPTYPTFVMDIPLPVYVQVLPPNRDYTMEEREWLRLAARFSKWLVNPHELGEQDYSIENVSNLLAPMVMLSGAFGITEGVLGYSYEDLANGCILDCAEGENEQPVVYAPLYLLSVFNHIVKEKVIQ